MIKRLMAGLLLMVGLSVTMVGLVTASASAQAVSPFYPAQGTTSTTDPCLVGNGTSATTNANCFGTQPPATAAVVPQASQTSASSGSGGLAFTGTDVIGMVVVAFLLIGGGILVVRVSRRRTA